MFVTMYEVLLSLILLKLNLQCFVLSAVTPYDYQPPGFKEGVNSHFLLFDGEPVSLRMGSVSSGFHIMKVKVTTEATRMLDGENGPVQENGTTEIAHQGLDCDEEEEDCSNHVRPSFSDPSLLHLSTVTFFMCSGHVTVTESSGACEV